jgi:hypothetical protein
LLTFELFKMGWPLLKHRKVEVQWAMHAKVPVGHALSATAHITIPIILRAIFEFFVSGLATYF